MVLVKSEKEEIIFILVFCFIFMLKEKRWFVYILECCDGSYYTGVSNDIDSRMKAHASGKGSKYVMKKGFKKLLYAKPCKNKSDACKEEYMIKKLPRNEKINYFLE
ncbi:MAG: GIY-YIG nuclease family protein [Candidatus Nanoarchaeia archaeon]|nr:GIY-YIG nuclease family protein [Candidatus Nanoarchaeia archaeon]